MNEKNKILIIFILLIIIISEILIANYFFLEKDSKNIKKGNYSSIVSTYNQANKILKENVLSPLKSIKKIALYDIFDFLPAYYLVVVIIIAFLIGQYLKYREIFFLTFNEFSREAKRVYLIQK